MASTDIDMEATIRQLRQENKSFDYIVGVVADGLESRLRFQSLDRPVYEHMARHAVANVLQNENHNREQTIPQKEKSFTFDSVNSPSKQVPQCDPTWSSSWSSEEGESSKSSQQRTRVPHRSPLTTSVNRNLKSPKRGRSPVPQTASDAPSQYRSRSRTPTDQSYRDPSRNYEHVSTRSSRSPVPTKRSPHRAAGESSPSVYYECETSFTRFRDNSPRAARDAESNAAVRAMNESMESLYVNAGSSPAFHRSMSGLNSSVQNLSFKEPSLNSSFQEPLNKSFQNCSLGGQKFSFDESSAKPSPTAAKMEAKTPMGASRTTPFEHPGTVDQFSPLEDTPQSNHPDVGTNSNTSSPNWAAPMSTSTTPANPSRTRSPVENATTFDWRTSATDPKNESTPPFGQPNDPSSLFASPVPEFLAPHQVFADSVPRGWRNVRPSPQPYPDADSPTFPNSRAQNVAQDPPAPTASSRLGAENPTVSGQPTASVQFNVDLKQPRVMKKATKGKRRQQGKTGSTRQSDNSVNPTSFDPSAASMGANFFAQPSQSNLSAPQANSFEPSPPIPSPPEPMDCGTPGPNFNDLQFSLGIGETKKSTGKPKKKRDVKRTPAPLQGQPTIPIQVQQPGSVPNQTAAPQFNLGVGDKSSKTKIKVSKSKTRAQRSQSAYFQSESVGSAAQFGSQDLYSRSFGQESSASTIRAMKEAAILALRDEAKALHGVKDFKGAFLKYTEAIAQFKEHCRDSPNKLLLPILFSNRAACLMRVGAFQAATEECERGLTIMPTVQEAASSDEFKPTFKAKLLCRMAGAYIHLGYVDRAENLFNLAEESIQEMLTFCSKNRSSNQANIDKMDLNKLRNEIGNGIMDIGKFREAMVQIQIFNKKKNYSLRAPEWEKQRTEVLVHVNFALSLATDCDELHEQKVSLLADLRRWREILSHCGRLAASRTKLDGFFVEDLASKSPFPGVAPAVSLKADYFQDATNDLQEAKKKLSPKSVAEAVLRLPYPIIPYYARSLRLEESYNSEEGMLDALEAHITNHSGAFGVKDVRKEFGWLPMEREKLSRTKDEKLRADGLFGSGAYEEAAALYEYCLDIDSNGAPSPLGAKTAGGRLHAILHCNRAACFMALNRYHEAATECTSALRIHQWYMKAMIRRARCYGKLNRHDESIAEYKRYIDIVNRARSQTLHFSPSLFPCIFEGPEEVTKAHLETAEKEMQDAIKEKENANAKARREESWKAQNEKFQQNMFNNGRSADPGRFREYFSSQSDGSRRWDSFSNRGPKRSHSKPRPKTSSQDNDPNRYSYKESNSSSSGSDGNNKDSRTMKFTNNSDHYSVLGVSRNATEAQIKKAFRKMALKYHPDKNSDKDAAEIFRRMKEAHEILMDPQSRRDYDFKQFGGGSCRW